MSSYTLKTQPDSGELQAFLATVTPETRQKEAHELIELMAQVSGEPPVLWGKDLIGFGRYHYTYDSGHSGEWFRMGFSPRKAQLVLYVTLQLEAHAEQLAQIGKHKIGKSCLYLPKWEQVDQLQLTSFLQMAYDANKASYPD